jgi:hypothetical protein
MARMLHIGGQSRTLELSEESSLQAMTWLPGNMTIQNALAFHRDPAIVGIVLTVALRASEPKITPKRVLAWMKAERSRFPEFEAAAMAVAVDFYREVGMVEDDDAGGAQPAKAPAIISAPHGSSSSVSPADTVSPPQT